MGIADIVAPGLVAMVRVIFVSWMWRSGVGAVCRRNLVIVARARQVLWGKRDSGRGGMKWDA